MAAVAATLMAGHGAAQDRDRAPSEAQETRVREAPRRAEPAGEDPPRAEPPAGEDPLRAAIEDLSFLAVGVVWYVIDERNVLDWDLDSIEERFSADSYRFDNNSFPINFIAHPLSGAAFYAIPRSNRLSMPVSALYGFVASFLWEFVIEFKERFSINDMIVTPLSGIPIGETFHRLSRMLDARAHPVLAWLLGLPIAAHEALDGRSVGTETPPSSPPWHWIRLAYGAGWARADTASEGFDLHTLSASMHFAEIEGLGQPGTSMGFFADAEVTSLAFAGFFSSSGMGFDLFGDTVLVGGHFSDVREAQQGGFIGGTIIGGTSISYLYRFEDYDTFHDRLGFTTFPGLALDLEGIAGIMRARFSGRLHGGFGGSHAQSFDAWQRANPEQSPKTILVNHRYYFGFGWMSRLELELTAGAFSLGGSFAYLDLVSQEGLDRHQDLVLVDVPASDELIEVAGFLRVSLPLAFFVEASVRAQMRASRVDTFTNDRSLLRLQVAAGVEL